MARTRRQPTTPKELPTQGNLSVAEVSVLLGTPSDRVVRWCSLKMIPNAKCRDGVWLIPARGLSFFCGRKLEPHYSVETAAAYLDKSEATLRAWLQDGSLKGVKTGVEKSASVLIPESELMRRLGYQ